MKRKTLIRLFLTSSIFLLFVTGCNKDVASVADIEELSSKVRVEAESTIAPIEDETTTILQKQQVRKTLLLKKKKSKTQILNQLKLNLK